MGLDGYRLKETDGIVVTLALTAAFPEAR